MGGKENHIPTPTTLAVAGDSAHDPKGKREGEGRERGAVIPSLFLALKKEAFMRTGRYRKEIALLSSRQ